MTSHSQPVEVITYETAAGLRDAALAHAAANGWTVAVVILDPWGSVVTSARMDGVTPPILDFATDKAYTATLGRSTRGFFERMSSTPNVHSVVASKSVRLAAAPEKFGHPPTARAPSLPPPICHLPIDSSE